MLCDLRSADHDHRVLRCLNTNGHLVTKEVARELVGLVDEVRVSMDGLREANDAVRGDGNFEAAKAALDLLLNVGFEPKVLVTVTERTVDDLERVLLLLTSWGINRVNVNRFRPVGRGHGKEGLRPSLDQIDDGMRRAWNRVRLGDQFPFQTQSESQSTCGVGRFLNIMPDGNVFPCHVLTMPEFSCGNVRDGCIARLYAPGGLLNRLLAADFKMLAAMDPDLERLQLPNTCMGTVYSRTRNSQAWKGVIEDQNGSPFTILPPL